MDITLLLYAVVWPVSAILSGIFAAVLARKKGYSAGYFWLGLIFCILGFIFVAGLPAKHTAGAPVKDAPTAAEKPQPALQPKAVAHAPVPSKSGTDAELIAVLTAAVAAFMDTTTDGLIVRSYRRLKTNKPSWNKAGRFEQLNRY